MSIQNEINRLNKLLSIWSTSIIFDNKCNRTDKNRLFEKLVAKILNELYGVNLNDLNDEEGNFPGIDLGDDTDKIAYQVTSQKGIRKVRETLEMFYDDNKKIYERFNNGVTIFYIIFEKGKINSNEFDKFDNFSLEKNRMDLTDLFKEMEKLYYQNYDRFKNIMDMLEKEFGGEIKEQPAPKYLTELPSKSSCFIGRTSEIALIESDLIINKKTVLVNGMGGIGKSVIAKEILRKNMNTYNHVGWFNYVENLRDTVSNQLKLSQISNMEISNSEKLKEFFNWLNENQEKSLIVIDNFDVEISDEVLEEIQSINSLDDKVTVLLTSRVKFEGLSRFDINFLPEEDLLSIFKNINPHEENEGEIKEIIKISGGHTLTVELLAKTMKRSFSTTSELIKTLAYEGFNLNELYTNEVKSDWTKESDLLFNHLCKLFNINDLKWELKQLLMNISILPSSVYSEFLKNCFGNEVSNYLSELYESGWITSSKDEVTKKIMISMHPVVKEVVQHMTKPTTNNCGHMMNFLCEENERYIETSIVKDRCYLDYMGESIMNLKKTEINDDLIYLSNITSSVFQGLGNYDAALKFCLISKAIYDDLEDEDKTDETLSITLNNLFSAYRLVGDLDEAILIGKESLSIENTNNRIKCAQHTNLSLAYRDLGEFDNALVHAENAEKLLRKEKSKYPRNYSRSLSNLGLAYMEKNNYNKALDYLLESKLLKIDEYGKDSIELAPTLNNLATVYSHLKNYDESMSHCLRAEKLFQDENENHPTLITIYANISSNYYYKDNIDESLTYAKKAVKIADIVYEGDHTHKIISYNVIAHAYYHNGNYEKALLYAVMVLEIKENIIGLNHPNLGESYDLLSNIYFEMRNFEKSLEMATKGKIVLEKKNYHDSETYNHLTQMIKILNSK